MVAHFNSGAGLANVSIPQVHLWCAGRFSLYRNRPRASESFPKIPTNGIQNGGDRFRKDTHNFRQATNARQPVAYAIRRIGSFFRASKRLSYKPLVAGSITAGRILALRISPQFRKYLIFGPYVSQPCCGI